MGIVDSIKSWQFPEDERFDYLTFIERASLTHPKKRLTETDDGYAKLSRVSYGLSEGYVHVESLKLRPITVWARYREIVAAYNKGKDTMLRRNLHEFRILMHMKYRGDVGGNKLLLTDRVNDKETFACNLPTTSINNNILKNENMVFEIELEGMEIRNFFYNSSQRALVNNARPSWIKGGGDS